MHKTQQTPDTPRDVTEISNPVFVKKAVAKDLKMRHLTQKAAGEMIGYGRQTMSNILSKAEYFSEKQAKLFSLAFGYNKEYLMTGKGNLLSSSSPEIIRNELIYKNQLLKMYREVQEASAIVIALIAKHGIEECKPMIHKLRQVNNFVKALDTFLPDNANGNNASSYSLKLIHEVDQLYWPAYVDLTHMFSKYGYEIEDVILSLSRNVGIWPQ